MPLKCNVDFTDRLFMTNNFRPTYLLILMQEYELKVACMSSFMTLQKDITGTTQQLTSLNQPKPKIMTEIYCAQI